MNEYKKAVISFLRKEDGPTAIECAIVLALVVVMCVVAIQGVAGPKVSAPHADNEPVHVSIVTR